MSDLPHPAVHDLPRPDELGPDPEPLGVRAERLLPPDRFRSTQASRPAVCPLTQAEGRTTVCIGARCPYYRVPGTYALCAVDQWSPAARREPRIAHWFMARRDEIARGRTRP